MDGENYTMKSYTLSVAEGKRQVSGNTIYSKQVAIYSLDDLRSAVQFDHVAGLFKNNERNTKNFISADCLMMDCDNGHSDKAEDWLTPEKLAERLPDVEFSAVPSRNNMKDKVTRDKKGNVTETVTARPRNHYYFPLSEAITKAATIRALKEKLLVLVTEFDAGAKDAARFFYGVEQTQAELFEGSLCVDEFLEINDIEPDAEHKPDIHEQEQANTANEGQQEQQGDTIKPGERHGTLLKVAVEALSKHGQEKAHTLLLKAAERCNPPKPIEEVNSIWEWALSKHNEFKEKFSEKKHVLTLRTVERTLQELNISVNFNVITRDLEISDLPAECEHLPEGYYHMDSNAKKQANTELLPLFLESFFKDKQFKFSKDFLTCGIAAIANTHRYNPVLDLIQATKWDGEDRITKLYHVLGIQDNEYHCGFLRKWLHQAIALAGNDDGAINLEFVLVLQGKQGVGKTNLFRALAVRPEWFKEGCVIDTGSKDSIIESTCVWLAEIGELDSTLRKEQASLKSFLTQHRDTYRRPYARKSDNVERRTCFCGTVNPEQVHRDDTGSRRFVYIHVDRIDKPFLYEHMTPEWCAQLWRQVYDTLYVANGRKGFYLTDEEKAYSEKSNEDFSAPIPYETEFLDLLDWDSDPELWHEGYTATEVLNMCGYSTGRGDATKAGRALAKLCKRFTGEEGKRSNGRTTYRVPEKRDPLAVYCN